MNDKSELTDSRMEDMEVDERTKAKWRIMKRDFGFTQEQCEAQYRSQLAEQEKRKRAEAKAVEIGGEVVDDGEGLRVYQGTEWTDYLTALEAYKSELTADIRDTAAEYTLMPNGNYERTGLRTGATIRQRSFIDDTIGGAGSMYGVPDAEPNRPQPPQPIEY